MKTTIVIMASLAGILLLSTVICGLWIANAGDQVTDREGSIKFHLMIAVTSVLVTLATLGLALSQVFKLSA